MKINLEIINSSYIYAKKEIKELHTKELVSKMIFRRRLTRAAKIVIYLTNRVHFNRGKIVYGSNFGEFAINMDIFDSLLKENLISPTSFQNSVYNTAISYLSILQNNQSEILTISCGDKTSKDILKVGAVKSLNTNELLLIATETLHKDGVDYFNEKIDFLESGAALRVKYTNQKANLFVEDLTIKLPKSINRLVAIAKEAKKIKSPIIEVEL